MLGFCPCGNVLKEKEGWFVVYLLAEVNFLGSSLEMGLPAVHLMLHLQKVLGYSRGFLCSILLPAHAVYL